MSDCRVVQMVRTSDENYLNMFVSCNAICEAENLPAELSDVSTSGFLWIDDGEHNISIEMSAK